MNDKADVSLYFPNGDIIVYTDAYIIGICDLQLIFKTKSGDKITTTLPYKITNV